MSTRKVAGALRATFLDEPGAEGRKTRIFYGPGTKIDHGTHLLTPFVAFVYLTFLLVLLL